MLKVCYKTCIWVWLMVKVTIGRLIVVTFAGENNFRKQLEKHF
jgi:hypothetical protein